MGCLGIAGWAFSFRGWYVGVVGSGEALTVVTALDGGGSSFGVKFGLQ